MLCRVKNFRFELDASREVDRLQKLWGKPGFGFPVVSAPCCLQWLCQAHQEDLRNTESGLLSYTIIYYNVLQDIVI